MTKDGTPSKASASEGLSIDYIVGNRAKRFASGNLQSVPGNRFPELGRIFYDHGPKSVIAGVLGEAAAAGELVIDDPDVAAWQFKALCEARLFEQYLWATRSSVTDAEINDNVEPACAMFLESFKAR
ncbi:TetR/AcrR family transcriptional regulator C-terminal domain-containing protein [Agrobacterium sp. 22-221-1]|uniref:TetR/AcrR family transcriptional regulator C-terminal domain-containing protein n=1 Tax=Agrobacterium leguminum TaxID=2792015 RepID=UPI003CE50BC1